MADRSMLDPLEMRCLLSAAPAALDLPAPRVVPAVRAPAKPAAPATPTASATPQLIGNYVGKLRIGQRIVMVKLVITSQTTEPMRTVQGRFSAAAGLAKSQTFGGFTNADGTFAARMGLSRLYVNKIQGDKLQGSVRLWTAGRLVTGAFSVVRRV